MKSSILVLTLICALVLAACGPAESSPSTDTPAQPSDVTTPEPVDAQAANPVKTPTKTSTGDDRAAFERSFSNRVEYMVDYDIVNVENGKSTTSSLTQYIRARSESDYAFRMDMTTMGTETRIYSQQEKYASCSKTDGAWQCFGGEYTEETEDTKVQSSQQEAQELADDQTSTIIRDGTKQVAGVTAECFKVTETDSSHARYCLKDSVPLYIATYDEKGALFSELTAKKYSTRVSDSDFVQPAKTQDIAEMTKGYTLPDGFEMPEEYN